MRPRVFVLGLGGTSISLLKPWAESGWLPNLDYLFRRGISGPLVSPVPPRPTPEWAAILTGRNPGHTGVFDQVRKGPVSYFPDRTALSSLATEGVWSLMNRFHRRTVLVNVPVSGESPEMTRTIGSHRVSMNDRNGFSIFEKALTRTGLISQRALDGHSAGTEVVRSARTIPFLEKMTQDTILQGRILGSIMETGAVDFVGVNFEGPDRILPWFWEEAASLGINGPKTLVEEALLIFFKVLDDAVGKLFWKLGPEDLVIVTSPHSFGPIRKFLSLNHFLASRGLLSFRSGKRGESHFSRLASPLFRAMGIRREPVKRVLRGMGIDSWLERFAPPFSSEIGLFDWGRTRAFSIARNGIHLNIRGLEPSGVVNPGKEARVLGDEIIQALQGLTDPDTGAAVIHDVCWRDHLYDGPRLGDIPHLVVNGWDPSYALADFDHVRDRAGIFSGNADRSGSHRKEGFFLMAGPGLPKGVCSETPLSIFDITPTILKNFNEELPVDLDGRAFPEEYGLSGAFRGESVQWAGPG